MKVSTSRQIEGEEENRVDGLRWYAVHTWPHHEKRVSEQLRCGGAEALLPTYLAVRRWKNRMTSTPELPLFPGYLFVRISLSNRLRVLSTSGVVSLIGAGRVPMPISDTEIDLIANRIASLSPLPYPEMAIGDSIWVKSGPLAGVKGTLVHVKNSLRLVISVELIMRRISVEVDAADIGLDTKPYCTFNPLIDSPGSRSSLRN